MDTNIKFFSLQLQLDVGLVEKTIPGFAKYIVQISDQSIIATDIQKKPTRGFFVE